MKSNLQLSSKIRMLKPGIKTLKSDLKCVDTNMQRKIVGANLSRRRFRIWKQKPFCNHCNLFVIHPAGYDLDHIVPLWSGGQDVDENCQILCKECHKFKSASEIRAW